VRRELRLSACSLLFSALFSFIFIIFIYILFGKILRLVCSVSGYHECLDYVYGLNSAHPRKCVFSFFFGFPNFAYLFKCTDYYFD
jgi:hypothetical protein